MPTAIMFDFDGTLFDTMGKYQELGSKLMSMYFGVSKRKAKNLFHKNAGIPFREILEKVFQGSSNETIQVCAKAYDAKKGTEVYEKAKPFKEVKQALEALKAKGYTMFVSSVTETAVVKKALEKHGLDKYFKDLYGVGPKETHVESVLGKGFDKVCFVGDSKVDADMGKRFAKGTVFTVGRAGKKSHGQRKRRTLLRAGATFVTTDLRSISTIDFGKAMEKSAVGKRYRRTPKQVLKHFKAHFRRR